MRRKERKDIQERGREAKGRAGGWVEGGGTVGRGMLFTLSTCMYGFKFRQHTGFTFIIRKKEPQMCTYQFL